MGPVRSLAGSCLAAAIILFAAGALAQSQGERLALSLRNNVVGLSAVRPGGNHEGFGIVAGLREGRLYIVTANHTVRGDTPDDLATQVQVRFYDDPDTLHEGRLLGRSDAAYDIAVVTVPVPPGYEWHRPALRADPRLSRGMPLWFIGREGEWYIPARPGNLNDVTLDFRILIDGFRLQVGSSGGPVIAEDGIVGMIVTDRPSGATTALAIDIIARAFALWRLPWDLEPLQALAAIPELSPEVRMHVAAGDRFLEAGQFARAIEEFNAAIEFDRFNTDIILRLVRSMRLKLWWTTEMPGRLFGIVTNDDVAYSNQIIQLIYRAQGLRPPLKDDVEWLLEEAYVRRMEGQNRGEAIRALERARVAAPDDIRVLTELGLLKTHISFEGEDWSASYRTGLDHLKKARKLAPDAYVPSRYLAAALALLDEHLALRMYGTLFDMEAGEGWLARRHRQGARGDLTEILLRWGVADAVPEPRYEDFEVGHEELVRLIDRLLEQGETESFEAEKLRRVRDRFGRN